MEVNGLGEVGSSLAATNRQERDCRLAKATGLEDKDGRIYLKDMTAQLSVGRISDFCCIA